MEILIVDKLINSLSVIDAGIETKPNYSFNHEIANVYAFRKGRNFIIPQF